MGHCSQDCPTGFPSGKGYKTLTQADALTAKEGKLTTAAPSSKPAPKPVAATAPSSDEEPNMIAAILPSASNFKSDSDEDADVSTRDMSAPINSKHFIWNCQIQGLKNDFPGIACALIDNGVHLVLIHPELVSELNLRKCRLPRPEAVDVTMQNSENSQSELYEYVKLSEVFIVLH